MYLFDFDGTLVDSNGVWVEIDNGFLARRGLTPTREYSDTVATPSSPSPPSSPRTTTAWT